MHQRPSHDHPTKQTPPEVKIAITDTATTPNTLVKLVSMGDTPYGNYTSNMEYWRQATLTGASFGASLQITSIPFRDDNEGMLGAFLANTPRGFTHGRNNPVWTWGQRQTASGLTGHLYTMSDPDAGSTPIGVLFEVDASFVLRAVVFYKNTGSTSAPTAGIWNNPSFTGTSLTKMTSADPRNLSTSGSAFWYRTLMGAQ